MKNDLILFAKGLAMGAANVIPGVSGGTIALITGIYKRLIAALSSIDGEALTHIKARDFRTLWQKVDGRWLCVLMAGVVASILTLARLFEWLLTHHERHTMAFFFGLILVSVLYVGQRVSAWRPTTWLALLIGTAIAIAIATLAPASPNASPLYVFLCGVLAISSMILPGLSGSFVLIILGNYALVLGAINDLDLGILVPLAAGCAIGLPLFSYALNWVFEHHEDLTLALMTGFVMGSLMVIWPWKHVISERVDRGGGEFKDIVIGYDWFMPSMAAGETWIALGLMLAGAIVIWSMETGASRLQS
ncbi:MAG: DUF368 domain-containing protein [Gammaproteobacteria bacterium]|nr:MAG: DUF368 domain-containing protein [Gammaproteobacteria bacterium]